MKSGFTTVIGVIGGFIASLFGGWDAALVTLMIFMGIDYVTGLIVAGVFHNSEKTENGSLESRAGWKGLCRKGVTLLALSPAISGGWTAGTEQQPGGAQHQALCDWPQELPVCQYPAGRPSQRGDLQPDRDSQGNWAGFLPLSDLDFENCSNAGSYRGGLGCAAAPG